MNCQFSNGLSYVVGTSGPHICKQRVKGSLSVSCSKGVPSNRSTPTPREYCLLQPIPNPKLQLVPDQETGGLSSPSFLSHRSTAKSATPSTCASARHTWAWVSIIISSILVFMSSGLLRSSRSSVTGEDMKVLQRRASSSTSSSRRPGEGLRAPELLGTISARCTCPKAAAANPANPASAAASPVPSREPPPAEGP